MRPSARLCPPPFMTSAAPSSSPVSITEEWLVGPLSTPFYTRTWQPKEEERTLVFVHGKVPPPSRPLSAVPSRTLSLDEQAGVGCASADMTSDVFSTHHRLLSLRRWREGEASGSTHTSSPPRTSLSCPTRSSSSSWLEEPRLHYGNRCSLLSSTALPSC